MSERYAKLKKDWMLRGWDNMPAVLVNWMSSDLREVNKKIFYVAESCDGQTDFNSLRFLPEHHAVLDKLIKEDIVEPCCEGHSIEPWQRYRKANNPRLFGIHWCVTGICNLHCRHCFMEAPTGRYGELSFAEMVKLIDQFEQANVIEISLTGGEPFLRKDLLELIWLLAQKRIQLKQIYSNGLLITDEHLEDIRKIGFAPGFQISFDGVGTHDHMRGSAGTEQRVIETVQRLRAAGFAVAIATSIDRLNIGCLPDTYELVKRLDVQSWRISTPQKLGNWRETTTAISLDQEAEVYTPLLERWLKNGKAFDLQLGSFSNGSRSRKAEIGLRVLNFTPDDYNCGACREQPCLLPDGTLVPCPGYVDSPLQHHMPNLLQENLSLVWKDSLLRRIIDMKKRDLLARNPECAACDLFKECGVGCRASALTETGDLTAKDPIACDIHKKSYKKHFRRMAASIS